MSEVIRGDTPSPSSFAERWWDHLQAMDNVEDKLLEFGCSEFEKLGTDNYDSSLEIYGAANEIRLSEEAQQYIVGLGFAKVYVNHLDGWETHYSFYGKIIPVRGWRRKQGDGVWLISYLPESWATTKTIAYQVVGDPLESKSLDGAP